ncbi:hypothetical protein EP47_09150 [Legionella norrlandica]|uniref:Uncharacterized protein n=1 Tax=Legionella norrlandica TaxID=1498499 RepID=A0A0A2SV37_9GAMM|nr:flagellar hook basal-body protein [Legionella norrlandica]KGP63289.1 hypothetical protein EP47_09150 [Legionella norrlandica]
MFDAITATQLAMEVDQLKLQSVSQNIANMHTPGFKRQLLEITSFNDQLQPNGYELNQQLQRTQISTQGVFTQTDRHQDLALAGDGYFQVQNQQGIFYTRRGDFQINSQGELCTATGETLLGQNGTIRVDDNNFTIDAQGILYINHRKVDQLEIVQFKQSNNLEYVGNGLYQSEDSPTPVENTRVLQGFLEQSNVKSIDEMLDMVMFSRHFQANQRVVRIADNLMHLAINQLGEGNV